MNCEDLLEFINRKNYNFISAEAENAEDINENTVINMECGQLGCANTVRKAFKNLKKNVYCRVCSSKRTKHVGIKKPKAAPDRFYTRERLYKLCEDNKLKLVSIGSPENFKAETTGSTTIFLECPVCDKIFTIAYTNLLRRLQHKVRICTICSK